MKKFAVVILVMGRYALMTEVVAGPIILTPDCTYATYQYSAYCYEYT